MFQFGSPEDTADLLINETLNGLGPALPDCHWEEMDEQDLRNVFTYLYKCIRVAYSEGVEDEVIDVLISEYDEVFAALAAASDRFKEAVRTSKHQPVLGTNREQVDKYKKLAGV